MSKPTKQHPSEVIADFLTYIDDCRNAYQSALSAVEEADSKETTLDIFHGFELKPYKERCRLSTEVHRSRLDRRANKDTVDELKDIVTFFDELNHKNTLNKLRQLLGKQRKTEEYLDGERVYKPRKKGDAVNEDSR
jgi:retron-type reverse transcriptase